MNYQSGRYEVHISSECIDKLLIVTETALDATDRALLALLRDDARAPTAELARKLKLSRTTVQSRIERLERQMARLKAKFAAVG